MKRHLSNFDQARPSPLSTRKQPFLLPTPIGVRAMVDETIFHILLLPVNGVDALD